MAKIRTYWTGTQCYGTGYEMMARIRELEAENKTLREGRGVTPDDHCAKFGAPRNNHPYRHPFESRAALSPAPAETEGE